MNFKSLVIFLLISSKMENKYYSNHQSCFDEPLYFIWPPRTLERRRWSPYYKISGLSLSNNFPKFIIQEDVISDND
jgi:hypothetical protein